MCVCSNVFKTSSKNVDFCLFVVGISTQTHTRIACQQLCSRFFFWFSILFLLQAIFTLTVKRTPFIIIIIIIVWHDMYGWLVRTKIKKKFCFPCPELLLNQIKNLIAAYTKKLSFFFKSRSRNSVFHKRIARISIIFFNQRKKRRREEKNLSTMDAWKKTHTPGQCWKWEKLFSVWFPHFIST